MENQPEYDQDTSHLGQNDKAAHLKNFGVERQDGELDEDEVGAPEALHGKEVLDIDVGLLLVNPSVIRIPKGHGKHTLINVS